MIGCFNSVALFVCVFINDYFDLKLFLDFLLVSLFVVYADCGWVLRLLLSLVVTFIAALFTCSFNFGFVIVFVLGWLACISI